MKVILRYTRIIELSIKILQETTITKELFTCLLSKSKVF